MNTRDDRAKSIFLNAAEIASDAERLAYLDEQCGSDPDLRGEVDELLCHQQMAGSFLGASASVLDVTIDQPPAERPGQQIGPYKLLEKIGEGGMGTVFVAEQHQPVRRRVALKLVKPGMDSRQVLARFEAERQALSLMDHPNIAKVLDAGTTESGRPYFVMELVKGQPITAYCDENHLNPRERLDLFLSACHAIQHAHQKGVIHRDIKPTNVLVAEYDGRPVAKVIDFGVAKAVHQPLTELTMYTGLGQIIGTLEYMSPEQARVNQLDIDTRSDVYSLGVLLYELLTGSTPFDRKRMREAALDELLRIIREEEPPRPSTRLSSSQTLPSIAANRRTEPARLSTLVRGELDWIVMKALEKDRNRRYETANGFAMDIQRYLSGELVQACPPSAGYRFRKFARRNKVALATATLVASAVLFGLIGTTWQAYRATRAEGKATAALAASVESEQRAMREKQEADAARKVAQEQKDEADAARREIETQRALLAANVDQALQALDEVYLQVAESRKLVAGEELDDDTRRFLERALPFYESFASQKEDDPQMQLGLAEATMQVGKIAYRLQQNDQAAKALTLAVERWDALLVKEPDSAEYFYSQIDSRRELFNTHLLRLRTLSIEEGEILYNGIVRDLDEGIRRFPDDHRFRLVLADMKTGFAGHVKNFGRSDEAEQAYREAEELYARLTDENPDDAWIRTRRASNLTSLGTFLSELGRISEAEATYQSVQESPYPMDLSESGSQSDRSNLASGSQQYAQLLHKTQRLQQARDAFEKSVATYRDLIAQSPADPALRQSYVNTLIDLCLSQRGLGEHEASIASTDVARSTAQALTEFWPDNVDYRFTLVRALFESASSLTKLDRFDEAQNFIERGHEQISRLPIESNPSLWRLYAYWTYIKEADIAQKREDDAAHERLILAALEVREPVHSEPWVNLPDFDQPAAAAHHLAGALESQGRKTKALEYARKAAHFSHDGFEKFPIKFPWSMVRESADRYGRLLTATGQKEALFAYTTQITNPHTRLGIAISLHKAGDTKRAEAEFATCEAEFRALLTSDTRSRMGDKMLAEQLQYTVWWLHVNGWPDAALRIDATLTKLLDEFNTSDPGSDSPRALAAASARVRGMALQKVGRIAEGEAELLRARTLWSEVLRDDSPGHWKDQAAWADVRLGQYLAGQARYREAEPVLRSGIVRFDDMVKRTPQEAEFLRQAIECRRLLIEALEKLDRHEEIAPIAREIAPFAALFRERFPNQQPPADDWTIGSLLLRGGARDEAAPLFRKGLDGLPNAAARYRVRIDAPGDYRLFVRAFGPNDAADSCYVRIVELADGPGGTHPDWYLFAFGAAFGPKEWAWYSNIFEWEGAGSSWAYGPAVWEIPAPGDYTLEILMREDGLAIDTLVLQKLEIGASELDALAESPRDPDGSFLGEDGRIVIEAEHFVDRRTGPHNRRWAIVPDEEPSEQVPLESVRNSRALQCLPLHGSSGNYSGMPNSSVRLLHGEPTVPAVELLRRALETEPTSGHTLVALGWHEWRAGLYVDAARHLREGFQFLDCDLTDGSSRQGLFELANRLGSEFAFHHPGDAPEAYAALADCVHVIMERFPSEPELWSKLGPALYWAGQYEEALEANRVTLYVAEGSKWTSHFLYRMAMAAARLERWNEAQKWYILAYAVDGGREAKPNLPAILNEGETLFARFADIPIEPIPADDDEARWARLLEADPDLAWVYAQRALVHRKAGREDEAKAAIAEAMAAWKRIADRFGDDFPLHRGAILAHKAAKYFQSGPQSYFLQRTDAQAHDDLHQVVTLLPRYVSGWNTLGLAHQTLNKSDEAVGDFTRALELSPGNGIIHGSRASAYIRLGTLDLAEADLAIATEKLGPNNEYPKRLRGSLFAGRVNQLIHQQQLDEAEERLTEFQAKYPEHGDVRDAQINLWIAREEYAKVVPHAQSLVARNGENWRVHYELALLQLASGDHDGYRATARLMAERLLDHTEPLPASFAVWTACLAPGGITEPEALLSRIESLAAEAPNSAQLQSKLGPMLFRAGRIAEALDQLKSLDARWDELEGQELISQAYPLLFLAMAQFGAGETESAQQTFERAQTLAKNELENSSNLIWNRKLTLKLLLEEAGSLMVFDSPIDRVHDQQ